MVLASRSRCRASTYSKPRPGPRLGCIQVYQKAAVDIGRLAMIVHSEHMAVDGIVPETAEYKAPDSPVESAPGPATVAVAYAPAAYTEQVAAVQVAAGDAVRPPAPVHTVPMSSVDTEAAETEPGIPGHRDSDRS